MKGSCGFVPVLLSLAIIALTMEAASAQHISLKELLMTSQPHFQTAQDAMEWSVNQEAMQGVVSAKTNGSDENDSDLPGFDHTTVSRVENKTEDESTAINNTSIIVTKASSTDIQDEQYGKPMQGLLSYDSFGVSIQESTVDSSANNTGAETDMVGNKGIGVSNIDLVSTSVDDHGLSLNDTHTDSEDMKDSTSIKLDNIFPNEDNNTFKIQSTLNYTSSADLTEIDLSSQIGDNAGHNISSEASESTNKSVIDVEEGNSNQSHRNTSENSDKIEKDSTLSSVTDANDTIINDDDWNSENSSDYFYNITDFEDYDITLIDNNSSDYGSADGLIYEVEMEDMPTEDTQISEVPDPIDSPRLDDLPYSGDSDVSGSGNSDLDSEKSAVVYSGGEVSYDDEDYAYSGSGMDTSYSGSGYNVLTSSELDTSYSGSRSYSNERSRLDIVQNDQPYDDEDYILSGDGQYSGLDTSYSGSGYDGTSSDDTQSIDQNTKFVDVSFTSLGTAYTEDVTSVTSREKGNTNIASSVEPTTEDQYKASTPSSVDIVDAEDTSLFTNKLKLNESDTLEFTENSAILATNETITETFTSEQEAETVEPVQTSTDKTFTSSKMSRVTTTESTDVILT